MAKKAKEKKEVKEDVQEQTDASSAKKGSLKKLILIGAIVVLVLGAGGGYILLSKPKPPAVESVNAEESGQKKDTEKKVEKSSEEGEDQASKEGAENLFPLDPFIVNLQEDAGVRYLKVAISLEIDGITEEDIKSKKAQIRDSLIILLSSKHYSEVGSVQGKYELRDEIASRVSQILAKGKVKGVYFTEFVIQ